MSLHLKTRATVPAVSLEDAKNHLAEDGDEKNVAIAGWVATATAEAEHRTGRSLMRQAWLLTLSAFPACIHLPRIPVASVVSVKYVDPAGTLQTLDSSAYTLFALDDHAPAQLQPAYGTSWPSTRSQPDAVQVEYFAGVEAAADLPPEAISWIKLQLGAMYANSDSEGSVQTYALGFADRLLDGLKVYGA